MPRILLAAVFTILTVALGAQGQTPRTHRLITSPPASLEQAGVPPEKIQESLKSIVAQVTGDLRGPGGHILTGPVYVEGAQPGDVLEARVLSIEFPIGYGYNGCNGFVASNCDRTV